MKTKAAKICAYCVALSGKDASTVGPHKTLFRWTSSAKQLLEAGIDTYRCVQCSTQWKVIYSDGKRAGEWTIVSAAPPEQLAALRLPDAQPASPKRRLKLRTHLQTLPLVGRLLQKRHSDVVGPSVEIPDHIKSSADGLAIDPGREDEMGAVIRAHIRIEAVLIKLVESSLPFPAEIKRLSLDYDGYVSLALALGLDGTLGPALRALGKLRNEFAHEPSTSLDLEKVNNLYQTLSSRDKTQVQQAFARIRADNESVRNIHGFPDLPTRDQFQLIVITLCEVVQAAQLLAMPEPHVRPSS